jgi:hypothetical protein
LVRKWPFSLNVNQRVGKEGGPKKGKVAKEEESIMSFFSYNNGA